MKILQSLDIGIVVPYSLRRTYQLGSVYPTQRVLVVDTDHCHLLYRAKTNHCDFILPILVMHLLPGTISIRGELQSLEKCLKVVLKMALDRQAHR